MLIEESVDEVRWALAVNRIKAVLTSSLMPSRLRDFGYALLLFAAINSVCYISDATLLCLELPWLLVSLPTIVIVSVFWGILPSLTILALSIALRAFVIFGVLDYHPPYDITLLQHSVIHGGLYAAVGALAAWIAQFSIAMRDRNQRNRAVVEAMKPMLAPDIAVVAPGYDLSSMYLPADDHGEVGTDFYDFFSNGDGQVGIVIGEVMDRGAEAATISAQLRHSARALATAGLRPANIVTHLNTLGDMHGASTSTASVFVALLEIRSGILNYCNAGHEAAMLLSSSGNEAMLSATGPMLGGKTPRLFEENTVLIEPDDALLLVSDGVMEARDREGFFINREDFWTMLRSATKLSSSEDALMSLNSAIQSFVGNSAHDDMTMLMLRATGERAAERNDENHIEVRRRQDAA